MLIYKFAQLVKIRLTGCVLYGHDFACKEPISFKQM